MRIDGFNMRKLKRKNPYPVNKSLYKHENDWTISKKLSEEELSRYYMDMYSYGFNEFIILLRDDILKGFDPYEVGIDPIFLYKREVSSLVSQYEIQPEIYNYKGFIEGYFDAANSIQQEIYLKSGIIAFIRKLKELEPKLKKSLVLRDCMKILLELENQNLPTNHFIKTISNEYTPENKHKFVKFYAVGVLILLKHLGYINNKITIMTYKNFNIINEITPKGKNLVKATPAKLSDFNDELDAFVNGKIVGIKRL